LERKDRLLNTDFSLFLDEAVLGNLSSDYFFLSYDLGAGGTNLSTSVFIASKSIP
jgi:hypothetical protein